MKIFIDSADTEEIKKLVDLKVIDGITTNPTLASKTGKKYSDLVNEIFGIMPEDSIINLEVINTDYEGILSQGRLLASLDKRVVVKIPCIPEGLKACKTLSSEGIRINITLVFSSMQALLVAKAGAYFVSPFVGRLDDISEDGVGIVEDMVQVYDNYDFKTEILFASIRSVEHIRQACLMGVDAITSPYQFIMEMYNHPLTDKGLKQFLDDWKNSGEEFITK
jgi:transaldolase